MWRTYGGKGAIVIYCKEIEKTLHCSYRPSETSRPSDVFIDRLYPRGITKETFAAVEWLKDIAPGTALRRFYHENPEENFAAFAARYHEELSGGKARQAVAGLLELEKAHGEVRILTAIRHPEQSHVSVLADFLGETFVYLDKTDGA